MDWWKWILAFIALIPICEVYFRIKTHIVMKAAIRMLTQQVVMGMVRNEVEKNKPPDNK